MRVIHTDAIDPTDIRTQTERDWIYNGLDCAITLEVWNIISNHFDEHTAHTYAFSKALQGPVLEMKLRGCRVDMRQRQKVIDEFCDKMDFLERNLERIALDGAGMERFNWRAPKDLMELFYNRLQIPPIIRQGKPTTNRDALEKLEAYIIARQIVWHIQALRELGKKIGFLRTGIDPDGRMRTSYNIAGTDTGRFSSSMSEFGTGTNLQNVEDSLRTVFVPDPGMKMAKFDAKSGESFLVGAIEWNLFKDGKYLDACETGDPHTAVAKICWSNLPWVGDLKKDKDIAEQPYYRHYTYRFMCKKLGHGSNYGGKAATLSQQAKLPLSVVEQFQPRYFKAFPAHLRWQAWVDDQLRKVGTLISLTGRKRQFWGRRNDDKTLRAAIAFDPQGSLADIVNQGMLNIYRKRNAAIGTNDPFQYVQILFQDHDAVTVQYPEEIEDEVIPRLEKCLTFEMPIKHGRSLTIRYDAKVGWNKGEYHPKNNPQGLKEWHPGSETRTRAKEVHILDRVG